MSMPEGIGTVDLMIGFPSANAHDDVWPNILRDYATPDLRPGGQP